MEIMLHLEEMKRVPEMSQAASILLAELKYRFRKFTDPNDAEHEPIFLIATMLDPRYRLLLNRPQTDKAKAQLLHSLSENGDSSSTSPEPEASPNADEEPPAKRFCHLSKVLEQKFKEGLKKAAKPAPGEQELERYLHATSTQRIDTDPILFWVEQEKEYPLLYSFSCS